MSVVFEGIVCFALDKDVQNVFVQPSSIQLRLKAINNRLTILYRPGRVQVFLEEIEDIAARLSLPLRVAMVVRFDSRIGYRSSIVFENGLLASTFAENDEIYVPLDDEGELVVDGPKLLLSDLKPGEEYGILQNAIQRGLESVGQDVWIDLFDFITGSDD